MKWSRCHQNRSGFERSSLMSCSGKFCHDFQKYILENSFVVDFLVLISHERRFQFLKLIWLNTFVVVNNQLIPNASIYKTPSVITL